MSLMIRKSYMDVVDGIDVDGDVLDEVWKVNRQYIAARFPDYYRDRRVEELILEKSNDSYTTMRSKIEEEVRMWWETMQPTMREYQHKTPVEIANLIEALRSL